MHEDLENILGKGQDSVDKPYEVKFSASQRQSFQEFSCVIVARIVGMFHGGQFWFDVHSQKNLTARVAEGMELHAVMEVEGSAILLVKLLSGLHSTS